MTADTRTPARTALAAALGCLAAIGACASIGAASEPQLIELPSVFSQPRAIESAFDVQAAFDSTANPSQSAEPVNLALFNPAASNASLQPIAPFWLTSGRNAAIVPTDAGDRSLSANVEAAFQEGPSFLERPLDLDEALAEPLPADAPMDVLVRYPRNPPLGYSGPSGVLPTEVQQSGHFVPIEDRWRIGSPAWDRYGLGQPADEDYPYELGRLINPYNQNVLKGDYPILGQHTFLNVTAMSFSTNEFRQVPTATTPFESTFNPFQEEFFGDPEQYFFNHNLSVSIDLFHGSAAFKPVDWRLKLEPIANVNVLDTREIGVVYPDVRRGTRRTRHDFALEQWFVEKKLADLGPHYDFASVRVGSQPFVSDFRGFVLKDVNRGVRLFGTRFANRDQFNVLWFDQSEKDTNSELNEFEDRNQNTTVVNYIRQDFVFPGFTVLGNFHYNNDQRDFVFDDNGFLVRPDPAGVFRPHEVDAYYMGFGTDGHIGRVNVVSQFYQVLGQDSLNPIAGCPQDINAQMAAIELSIDRDWIRFRTSFFFASGDEDPNDSDAEGFDTILDNPNFAGGEFSFWQRQAIKLFGVNLVQRKSLVPDLRSSKIQGQSNFVNPGLLLVNYGMDFEITPKLKAIANANYLWFDKTEVLETFVFQSDIDDEIGADLSLGFEYRPRHNDNIILAAGVATLLPGNGFDDLYGEIDPFTLFEAQKKDIEAPAMAAAFLELALVY
jgi:hypothetical protein